MMLRGSRVLARCDDGGELQVEAGRVEVRYRPTDGKAYKAGVKNLSPVANADVYPDDHCVAAEPAKPKDNTKNNAKRRAKSKAKKTPVNVPDGAEEGEVVAYTDGACSGNPGPAGLGVVLFEGENKRELSEYLGVATNNVAELSAIKRAAQEVTDLAQPVRILTDSQYAIGVLTKGWKAKANKTLVADTKKALSRLENFELLYVPGHAGVAWNERADELAVAAVKNR